MNTEGMLTINNLSAINAEMITDRQSDENSSPESEEDFNNSDILDSIAVTVIASSKKRKRPHCYETNPSARKRQQIRLLRKLKCIIDEYTARVGQQAAVVCCTPNVTNSFKTFGAQPLKNVILNCKEVVMQEVETMLAQQAPVSLAHTPGMQELPPLSVDGVPTPVDKMTQAQLRAFIPEMLKYSTGRSKLGWGKLECRPIWWPEDVPWANVRSDVRAEIMKKTVSWTHALRTIVRNCYKHHGREDLLPESKDETVATHHTVSHFAPTMVQTINNPDGTVSIIQIDTSDSAPQMVTLADGTQAQVVHTLGDVVHASAGASSFPQTAMSLEIGGQTGMTISPSGQLVLSAESLKTEDDKSLTGVVTIPVSMYQNVVNNITQLQEVRVDVDPVHMAAQVHSDTDQSTKMVCEEEDMLDDESDEVENIKPSPNKYFS